MLKIGITGGIGSGKSMIARIFNTLGIPIYNSDERAKWLSQNDSRIKNAILINFGEEVFNTEGKVLTQKLGQLVFNDAQKLEILNHIIHPIVAEDFSTWASQQKSDYVLKEAAIIFEHHIQKQLDAVILVVSPLEFRINNILKRDPFRSEESIRNIISKQMSDAEKMTLANYIIQNNENELVVNQVLAIHSQILKKNELIRRI